MQLKKRLECCLLSLTYIRHQVLFQDAVETSLSYTLKKLPKVSSTHFIILPHLVSPFHFSTGELKIKVSLTQWLMSAKILYFSAGHIWTKKTTFCEISLVAIQMDVV